MPKHLQIHEEDTTVNLLAMTGLTPGLFYKSSDTGEVYVVLANGTVGKLAEGAAVSSAIPVDSSSAAIAIPLAPAIGLGAVIFYVNKDITNSATLTVPSGESINGAIDGAFIFSNYPAGTQFRVDDYAAGKWCVSVVGASSLIQRNYIAPALTEITAPTITGTLTYTGDSTPSSNEVSIESLEYFDEGTTRTVYLTLYDQHDNQYILDLGSNIVPSGASIKSVVSMVDQGFVDSGGNINASLVNGQSSQFYINRTNAIDNDIKQVLVISVDLGSNGGQVVLAGMVPVNSLASYAVSRPYSPTAPQLVNTSDLTFAGSDVVDLSSGSITKNTNDFTIASSVFTASKAGHYTVDFSLNGNDAGGVDNRGSLHLGKNGVQVASSENSYNGGFAQIHNVSWSGDLVVGDTIEARFGTDLGQQVSVSGFSMRLQELPSSTVVNPDTIPVEDVKVLLGSGIGIVNGGSVTINDNWGNLSISYDQIEIKITGISGATAYRQSQTIESLDWQDDTATVFVSDALNLIGVSNMDSAGSTLNLDLSGAAVTQATVNVYGIKPQKTVINTEDVNVSDWQAWTLPALGATITAPTEGAGVVKRGMYKIIGKTLCIKGRLDFSSASGTANGSGEYLLDISSLGTINISLTGTGSPKANGTDSLSIGSNFWHDVGIDDGVGLMFAQNASEISFLVNKNGQFDPWSSAVGGVASLPDIAFETEIPIL